MKFLPLAPFAPDLPAYQSSASRTTKNVIPATKIAGVRGQPDQVSYGPLASITEFSSALAARCQGAYSLLDPTGNAFTFAGDASKLYKLDVSGPAFADVSQAGGYSTASDGSWRATLFGSAVIFTNFNDPIQSYVLGSSTDFADLSVDAPRARYIAQVRDFLVLANVFDATDGFCPQRVHWSAVNDPGTWPARGTVTAAQLLSDAQDLVSDAGWVQGVLGSVGTADGIIFQERAVVRMQFSGTPRVFDFQVAEGIRGTPSPGSIVQVGSVAFYQSEDGFAMFNGSASTQIGAGRVDNWYFTDGTHGVDQEHFHRVVGAADPIRKCVMWAYPGPGNLGGNPNRLLIYNWQLDEWSFAEIEVELLTKALSFGFNLDTLDSTGYTLDTLPVSLDSRTWTKGRIILSAFTGAHKLGYFVGAALAPTVETMEFSAGTSVRSIVTNSRAIVDANGASVAIGVRQKLGDLTTWGPAILANSVGYSPQRSNGLYTRARITLPAASTFKNIQGVELEVVEGGSR